MARAATKSVEGVIWQPKYVLLRVRVSWWRPDDGGFILGKAGISERILAVTLLEDATVLHGYGCEETQGGVLQHGGLLLALLPEAAFEVAEDNDARLGPVGCHVLIALDGHYAHGGDCPGN